jgi:hypothetical protein
MNSYKSKKEELIRYLYNTINVSQFKYEIINNVSQLDKIVSSQHYLSAEFFGKNCFLVFTKLKSNFYSFLIDRTQLKYKIDDINFDTINIQQCNVDVDISIYTGTIFDGTYIIKNNKHTFMCNDVYYFKGTDCISNNLQHKLLNIQMYFNSIGSTNTRAEMFDNRIHLEIQINKLQDVKTIRSFVNDKIVSTPEKKTFFDNFMTRGLCFWPQKSGTKLLYIYGKDYEKPREKPREIHKENHTDGLKDIFKDSLKDKDNIKDKDNLKDKDDFKQTKKPYIIKDDVSPKKTPLSKKSYVAKNDSPIYAILEMKATRLVDNYKMYAIEKVVDNNVPRLKKYQLDIAYIPNIKKSKWCKDITVSSTNGSVLVKCLWKDDKRKWEPMEHVTDIKFPSYIDEIREKLIEIDQSDSDCSD